MRFRIFAILLLLLILVGAVFYFANYARNNPPNPTEVRIEIPHDR